MSVRGKIVNSTPKFDMLDSIERCQGGIVNCMRDTVFEVNNCVQFAHKHN